MTAICIIDTSIFCNILGVPHKSQRQEQALAELQEYLEQGATLLLPLATIFETGNHIAQNGDGRMRRLVAEKFVIQVKQAFSGEAPWTPTPMQNLDEIMIWLEEFPNYAMRETGFGDLSIIQVFGNQCALHTSRQVLIWSYDQHLRGFDQPPRI